MTRFLLTIFILTSWLLAGVIYATHRHTGGASTHPKSLQIFLSEVNWSV